MAKGAGFPFSALCCRRIQVAKGIRVQQVQPHVVAPVSHSMALLQAVQAVQAVRAAWRTSR